MNWRDGTVMRTAKAKLQRQEVDRSLGLCDPVIKSHADASFKKPLACGGGLACQKIGYDLLSDCEPCWIYAQQ